MAFETQNQKKSGKKYPPTLNFKLTDAENAMIEAERARLNLSRSDFMRYVLGIYFSTKEEM